jgi:hypothetical protein
VDENSSSTSAVIELNGLKFSLKWKDFGLQEPDVLNIDKFDLTVVGVGSTVVAISRSSGIVKFCCGLIDPFSFLVEIDSGFLAVSETSILSVNGKIASIQQFVVLPDIITDVRQENGKLLVECLSEKYVL